MMKEAKTLRSLGFDANLARNDSTSVVLDKKIIFTESSKYIDGEIIKDTFSTGPNFSNWPLNSFGDEDRGQRKFEPVSPYNVKSVDCCPVNIDSIMDIQLDYFYLMDNTDDSNDPHYYSMMLWFKADNLDIQKCLYSDLKAEKTFEFNREHSRRIKLSKVVNMEKLLKDIKRIQVEFLDMNDGSFRNVNGCLNVSVPTYQIPILCRAVTLDPGLIQGFLWTSDNGMVMFISREHTDTIKTLIGLGGYDMDVQTDFRYSLGWVAHNNLNPLDNKRAIVL